MKITKKTLKEIKKGNRDALLNIIDELLDIYQDDKFTNGYNSCVDDLRVHSRKLAVRLREEAELKGVLAKRKGDKYYLLDEEETCNIIFDYLTEVIQK